MKSVCTDETLMPRSRSSSGPSPSRPSTPNAMPEPYAMWQVAFSSNSVSKYVMPVWPTRDVPSTSATSPSRFANSSIFICPRTASSPVEARTSTASPPSNRISRSRTIVPPSCSGRVERTVPSVRRQSGHAKTSSVGRFAHVLDPVDGLEPAAAPARAGDQPDLRSVPGPA